MEDNLKTEVVPATKEAAEPLKTVGRSSSEEAKKNKPKKKKKSPTKGQESDGAAKDSEGGAKGGRDSKQKGTNKSYRKGKELEGTPYDFLSQNNKPNAHVFNFSSPNQDMHFAGGGAPNHQDVTMFSPQRGGSPRCPSPHQQFLQNSGGQRSPYLDFIEKCGGNLEKLGYGSPVHHNMRKSGVQPVSHRKVDQQSGKDKPSTSEKVVYKSQEKEKLTQPGGNNKIQEKLKEMVEQPARNQKTQEKQKERVEQPARTHKAQEKQKTPAKETKQTGKHGEVEKPVRYVDGRMSQNERRGNQGGRRRQVFDPYWKDEDISHGLKRSQLIQGALRINPKNYEDCYVPHPDGVSDIYIRGMKDRNRALNGDVVAVMIYPRDQWKVLMDDFESDPHVSKKLKDSLSSNSSQVTSAMEKLNIGAQNLSQGADSNGTKTPTKGSQSAQKKGAQSGRTNTPNKRFVSLRDLCSSSDSMTPQNVRRNLFEDQERSDDAHEKALTTRMESVPNKLLLRTGKVVGIIEKKHSRASTGHIRAMQDRNPNQALFVSKDHRFPRVFVPMEDCPKDFLQRADDHKNTLFIARLTEWSEDSAYPKGRLARSLGEAGEIEPETEGMLVENSIDFSEFSNEVIDCLPQNLPWSIPQKEFEYRKDLRKECIFTIDPATARDLDDALHCTKLEDGSYEIGVHIADVSFFINEFTALDEVAASRATSVYLVQKVIPMLPRLLCEQLCSLNPDEDRLAFSVIWKMTEDGEIYDEWFGRSVICSCAKLSYDHAQGFIEDPNKVWEPEELPRVSDGFTIAMIVERVLNLNKVAKHLRKKRYDGGALRLDQVKLAFALDKDSGLPCGYSVYKQRDSNRLIEEFMLLANMAVAHKIYKTYPEVAMLRRHPAPQAKQMDDLVAMCKSMGIQLDGSSSGALQRSLSRYTDDSLSEQSKLLILTALASKPMQIAKYFCTGCIDDEEVYRHYALSVPLYTHFTSPIRRYPDVVVHRLLAAAIGLCDVPSRSKGEVQTQAEHCNDKKLASKRVQELSSEMFFAIFVKECGPLEEKGMVMGVLDKSFDVLVLSLGVVKRIYCEQLPLASFDFKKDHRRPELTIVWKESETHANAHRQIVTIFTEVNCILEMDPDAGPLKWKAIMKHPLDD